MHKVKGRKFAEPLLGLRAKCMLGPLRTAVLTPALQGSYYCPHFTDEETGSDLHRLQFPHLRNCRLELDHVIPGHMEPVIPRAAKKLPPPHSKGEHLSLISQAHHYHQRSPWRAGSNPHYLKPFQAKKEEISSEKQETQLKFLLSLSG